MLGVDAIPAAFTVLHKICNACTRDCLLCCRVLGFLDYSNEKVKSRLLQFSMFSC